MSRQAVLGRVAMWAALALGLTIMWVRYGAATATTLLTILTGAFALTQAVAAWRWRTNRAGASTAEELDRAAEALGWAVRTQWEAEAARRLLGAADGLAVHWQARGGPDGGDLARLISSFVDRPRRLAVIGEPGSGKTGLCVLLTLELLRSRDPELVPVLVQISSWRPAENLHSWLIRTILENYPFLADETRYGTTAVRDLLAQHRILPILDGLDEMAADLRADALQAVAQDVRDSDPLVLTCRTSEFDTANRAGAVRSAQVVRLLPVDAQTAADYLLDSAPDTTLDRWDRVLTRLTEDEDTPVAQALRTPLMLFLARTGYARPDADPAELLDLPDRAAVEEHLLDVFTEQVFRTRPASPLTANARPERHWDPARAERWLAYLARNCGREIAWWQLYRLVPFPVWIATGVVVGGLGCAPLGLAFFGLFGRPVFGVLFGLAVGVAGGVGLHFLRPNSPRRLVPRWLRRRELARDLWFGAIGALVGGIVVGLLWGAWYGPVIGLVFGLVFGLVHRFTQPTEAKEAVTPIGMLRGDRHAVEFGGALGAITGAVVGAVMGGVVGGAATRELVFRIDNPVLVGLLGAVAGAVVGGCGLALTVVATSASGRFLVTRIWLALRGLEPLRLMTFLDDAHRRGVLRQVGPYYQFRHAVLQDRLASRSGASAGGARTPEGGSGRR